MVKRKIVWSHRAKIKLYKILEFFANRNQSKTYSAKLYNRFTRELELVNKHPDLGIRTDIDGVRGLIAGDYIIFYECTVEFIIVHTIWDCRQNPNDLSIK